MEVKWLEDFLALAQYQNFSRAAESRNLTQSGFSRRIQALEQWVGTPLIDRSAYPPSITPAGQLFKEAAQDVLRTLMDARAIIRAQHRMPGSGLQIAAGHTIALNFLPQWLKELAAHRADLGVRVVATNGHDSVLMLMNGSCEMMLAYHHPEISLLLDPARYAFLCVGRDTLMPICVPDATGAPLYPLPGTDAGPAPLLAYTDTSYFGRCLRLLLQRARPAAALRVCYESDMAEVLKQMVLQGLGVAWVPQSSIGRQLEAGEVVPAGVGTWCLDLELRLYRDLHNKNTTLEELWSYLETRQPADRHPVGARNRAPVP